MATALQLRKGTTLQHASFSGLQAEVTVDTDKNTLIVHDGSTVGGYQVALVTDIADYIVGDSGITVTKDGSNANISIDYDGFSGNVIPTSNAAFDLGSSSLSWNKLYGQQLLLQAETSPNTAQIQHLGITSSLTTTNSTAATAIDTLSATDFRSARYTVQITNDTDSEYHVTEILLLHNGTTALVSEYGILYTAVKQAEFSADINNGTVRLLATPSSTDAMTFKVTRHSLVT